jgi:hypothetical protein
MNEVDIQEKIIQIANPNPKFQLIRQQMARVLAVFFSKAKKKAAHAAIHKTAEFGKFVKKTSLTEEQKKEIIFAAYAAISWQQLVDGMEVDLFAAAQTGAAEGLVQTMNPLELDLQSMNQEAKDYATKRSAEMIGMRYEDDKLVADPKAKFDISATTKDDLTDIIEESFSKDETLAELTDRILTAATFSDLRAQFIAKQEVGMAQVYGHTAAWKSSKQVQFVNVVLSDAHVVVDFCDQLVAGNPYPIDNVPLIPAHPSCQCLIIAL